MTLKEYFVKNYNKHMGKAIEIFIQREWDDSGWFFDVTWSDFQEGIDRFGKTEIPEDVEVITNEGEVYLTIYV